ncbi:hypothetical protein SEPCBS57363_004175, partial [Sporothrix epigloea]
VPRRRHEEAAESDFVALGRHDCRPIVDKAEPGTKNPLARTPLVTPPHVPYSVALQDTFRDQGLQVLVEISSIDLTPEMPAYGPDTAARTEAYKAWAAGQFAKGVPKNKGVDIAALPDTDGWKLAGQLNEHIVAVAMFAFDTENVTEPRVAFRQKLPTDTTLYRFNECYNIPDDAPSHYEHVIDGSGRYGYHSDGAAYYDYEADGPAHLIGKEDDIGALAEILGISGHDITPFFRHYNYQHIGSVAAPQGRLVAFPNVLEHRIEPFRLVDGTKPGRYRWLTLYLVDPHYRLCSTRNVPPQQHDWWAAAMGRELAAGGGLPTEVIDNIMQYTDEWPMGMEEAAWHREQMVKERLNNVGRKFRYVST